MLSDEAWNQRQRDQAIPGLERPRGRLIGQKKPSDNLPNDKARRERDDEPMIEIYISAKTFDDTSSTGSELTGLGQLLLLVIAMLRYCGKKHVLRCCAHRGSCAVRNCVTADIGLLWNQSRATSAEVSLLAANLVVTQHLRV